MFQDNQSPQPEQPTQSTPPEQTAQPVNEQPVKSQQPSVPEQPQQQSQDPQKPAAPVVVPEKTTQEERMWAAIGYIAFLGVVTLAIKPKSEFCKHHAAQGLTIFVIWFISLILFAMPSFIGVIGGILLFGATGLAIFGISKAIQSYKLELPVLSSIAKKIPTDSIIGSVTGKTPEVKKSIEGEIKPTEEVKPEEEVKPAEETQQQPPVQPTTEQPVQSESQPEAQDKPEEKQNPPTTPPQA